MVPGAADRQGLTEPPRSLHVGVVTHEPFWPPSGGGSSEAPYLVEHLVSRGHRVTVFAPAPGPVAAIERRFGICLDRFALFPMERRTRLRTLKYLAFPVLIERHLETRHAADPLSVVLAQHSISGVAAGRFGRRRAVPVVLNYLDCLTGYLDAGGGPRWACRPLVRRLQQFELGMARRYHAAAALTISATLADALVATGLPAERVLPIYYGFDERLFDPRRARCPQELTPGYVLMHGSWDDHHLGDVVPLAIDAVLARRPATRFVIAGQGRRRYERLRRRGAARWGAAVRFVGWVDYERICDYLAGAAVGLVPYPPSTGAHYTVACKLIECVAMGVPSVCTALRGTQRYFADEPLVRFADFTPESLADAVVAWLETSPADRRQIGEPGSARIRREQSWSALAARVAGVIEAAARDANR